MMIIVIISVGCRGVQSKGTFIPTRKSPPCTELGKIVTKHIQIFSAENKHPLNEILPRMLYYFINASRQLISLILTFYLLLEMHLNPF